MNYNQARDIFYSVFPNKNKYLDYGEGESNIILSAPHGGGIKPFDIPYRSYGNRSGDTYTRRLIKAIIDKLDKKPYYIYADIHRSRVDLNRDIGEGAQGNFKAQQIWNAWNRTLDYFTDIVSMGFSKGLYIDIHSHNKSNKFEIGYGLGVKDYLAVRKNKPISSKSTMYGVKRAGYSEYSTLFGNISFPNILEYSGYDILVPTSEASYLNGGRNIREFSGNSIGALQIECPISVLRYDLSGVASSIAVVLELFTERHCNA